MIDQYKSRDPHRAQGYSAFRRRRRGQDGQGRGTRTTHRTPPHHGRGGSGLRVPGRGKSARQGNFCMAVKQQEGCAFHCCKHGDGGEPSSPGSEKVTPACWNASLAVHSPASILRIASTSSAPWSIPGAKMQASKAPTSFPEVTRSVTVFETDISNDDIAAEFLHTSYAMPIFSGLDWWEYALNRGSVGEPR